MYTNNSKCGSNEIFVVLPVVRQASSSYVITMWILWEYYENIVITIYLKTNRHQQILTSTNDCQQI